MEAKRWAPQTARRGFCWVLASSAGVNDFLECMLFRSSMVAGWKEVRRNHARGEWGRCENEKAVVLGDRNHRLGKQQQTQSKDGQVTVF